MNWLELKKVDAGAGHIILISCTPFERAYLVKKWLQENKPDVTIIYAGEVNKIRPYQVEHWVQHHPSFRYRDYNVDPAAQKAYLTASESFQTALQQIEIKHKYVPSEILLVRSKKFIKT